MTALPAASSFTGSTVTEAQFKSAITDQHDFLAGLFGTDGLAATALDTVGAALSGYAAKTAAYTTVQADKGNLIDCTTGTWTLSLHAVATAGNGYVLAARNSGTGVITIDPNATETIDGNLTITLNPGENCLLYCTGAAWLSIGKSIGSGRLLAVTILTSGTSFSLNPLTTQVEVGLCGAGAGGNQSGGGGAGQYVFIPRTAASGSLSYTIGAGSAGTATAPGNGTRAGNSTCLGVTAYGGWCAFTDIVSSRPVGGFNGGRYGATHGVDAVSAPGYGGALTQTSAPYNHGGSGSDGSPALGGQAAAAASATAGGLGAGGGGGKGSGTTQSGGGAAGSGPNGGNGGNGSTTNSSSGAAGGGGYIIIWEYS